MRDGEEYDNSGSEDESETSEQSGPLPRDDSMFKMLESLANSVTTLTKSVIALAETQKKFFANQTTNSAATPASGITASSPPAMISRATNPMTAPIDLGTKAGSATFAAITEVDSKDKGLIVNVANRSKLQSHFRILNDARGYAPAFTMPTSGTGKPDPQPKKLPGGGEAASVDIKDTTNISTDFSTCTRDELLKWVGWIHGDVHCGLHIPTTRIQKTLDFENSDPNLVLVALMKHQLRIRCDALMIFFRKLIEEANLNTFLADKEVLTWTKQDDGTKFTCGLTFMWQLLECVEPKAIMDSKEYERIIKATALGSDCQGDIHKYCNTVLEAWNTLTLKHSKTTGMSADDVVDSVLSQLMTVDNELFKTAVQNKFVEYLSSQPNKIKPRELTNEFITLYQSLVHGKIWDDKPQPDPKVLALRTEIKKLSAENRKLKKSKSEPNLRSASGGGNENTNGPPYMKNGIEMAGPQGSSGAGVQMWRTIKKGEFATSPVNGALHQWCPLHFQGNGLYMKCNSQDGKTHDHAAWEKWDKEKNSKRKGKKREKTPGKPSLSVKRSRKGESSQKVQAMVAQLHMSQEEAERVDAFYTGTYDEEEDSDEESK